MASPCRMRLRSWRLRGVESIPSLSDMGCATETGDTFGGLPHATCNTARACCHRSIRWQFSSTVLHRMRSGLQAELKGSKHGMNPKRLFGYSSGSNSFIDSSPSTMNHIYVSYIYIAGGLESDHAWPRMKILGSEYHRYYHLLF